MSGGSGSGLASFLTVLLVGGLAGFIVFGVSHAISIWQARNLSGNGSHARRLRWSMAAAILGCMISVAGYLQLTFEDRSGYADATDLFVVHGRRGVPIQSTTQRAEVTPDTVVAEFDGPAERAMLHALGLRMDQARRRREATLHGALTLDSALLQEAVSLRNQIMQIDTLLQDLDQRRLQLELDRAAATASSQRESETTDAAIALAQNDFADAQSRTSLADRNLARADELYRSGFTAQQVRDTLQRERTASSLAATRHQQTIAVLQQRRHADLARQQDGDARFARQLGETVATLARYSAERGRTAERLASAEDSILHDRERARRHREAELTGHDIELLTIEAERQRIEDTLFVRAPFAGRVVYRHPAPQLAGEQTPILAVTAGDGLQARVRLRSSEVAALRGADDVRLILDAPVLNPAVSARFVRSEPIPSIPGFHLVVFDCAMTPELLPHLANPQSRIGARLLWTPPLVTSVTALIGLAVMLCGLAGLLTGWFDRRRQVTSASTITGDGPLAESIQNPQLGPTLAVLHHVANPLDRLGQHATKFAPATSRHVMAHYLAFRFAKQVSEGVVDPALIDQVRHRITIGGSAFGTELLAALQTQLPSMSVDALIAHIAIYDAPLAGQLRELQTQLGTVGSASTEPAKVSESISLSVA